MGTRVDGTNPAHPVFAELSALLRKTIGLADVLTLALTPVANRVSVAFVFGSVAQARDTALSDVDVMVIGDFGEVVNLLFEAQTTLQREINPKVFSTADWHAKLAANAPFALDVLAKPKLFLIGSQHDLGQLDPVAYSKDLVDRMLATESHQGFSNQHK